MNSSRSTAVPLAFLLAILASSTIRISAKVPAPSPSPSPSVEQPGSVHGTLESLVTSRNGVIMRSDSGNRLAWKFTAPVIAELGKFKPGDPMVVIYRAISPSDQRVTAVAFPAPAAKPTYVNMTGSKVFLRTAPLVGGVCSEKPGTAPASEFTIQEGGRAEVTDACWCCAPTGEICAPSNQSRPGQVFLVKCFK